MLPAAWRRWREVLEPTATSRPVGWRLGDAFMIGRAIGARQRGEGPTRARLLGIVGAPAELEPLLDAALPLLQARYDQVLVEAEAWWPPFGWQDDLLDAAWARHRFGTCRVLVLQQRAPREIPTRGAAQGIDVRPWRRQDLAAAADLMTRAPDPLQLALPGSAAVCLDILDASDLSRGALAWRERDLVGLVSVTARDDIGQLYVAPDCQGQGLGGALLDLALDHCAGAARPPRLTMVEGNRRALALYHSRGFRAIDAYPCRVWR